MKRSYYGGNFYSKLAKSKSFARRGFIKSWQYGMSRSQYKGSATSMPTGRTYYSDLPDVRSMKRFKGSPISGGEWVKSNTPVVQSLNQPDYFRPDGTYYSRKKPWWSPLERIEHPIAVSTRLMLKGAKIVSDYRKKKKSKAFKSQKKILRF